MSSTTTTTATTTSSRAGRVSTQAAQLRNWSHLSDYELHHSNTPSEPTPRPSPTQPENAESEPSVLSRALQSPNDWPSNHRRIPPHRPVDTELDQSQRRVYNSTGEQIFITVMLQGVNVNANLNRAWNATLGKVVGPWFGYKIGGEW